MSAFDTQVGGSHYKNYKIQPMQFFIANNLNYPVAAIIKYVMRYKDKNGIQDLDKAIHIIEMLKEELFNAPQTVAPKKKCNCLSIYDEPSAELRVEKDKERYVDERPDASYYTDFCI